MRRVFAPTCADGYKFGHPNQYPADTCTVFAGFTPRGSRVKGVDRVCFLNFRYMIQEYLIDNWNETFFSKPAEEVIPKYVRRLDNYLGKGAGAANEKWMRELHKLGYLPLEIWALPEGSMVNIKVPMFVIFNTHPEIMTDVLFGWVTNSLETILSTTSWLGSTSATTAVEYRKLLNGWATKTNPEMLEFVEWQGHDFSMRGHTSLESACLSAMGHLLAFRGTDTYPVFDYVENYYGMNAETDFIGGSVPATEHSVMCVGGKEDEVETFRRLITETYPAGIVSIVSDTWDFWNVVDPENGICSQLKDLILARDGKVVIRPDSGDPVKIVTGYMHNELGVRADGSYYELSSGKDVSENEAKGMIQCLYDIFGGTESSTGYIQLDPHIGAIYGDSITLERARQICERLSWKGFASTNLVYGIGSFTYQGAIDENAIVTRDTFGFAMKSTAAERLKETSIELIEIFKDPKTDDGLKKSAKGLMAVYEDEDGFYLKDQATWEEVRNCAFRRVFFNGVEENGETFAQIRERVQKTIN